MTDFQRGHRRTGSDAADFKVLMRSEALDNMKKELDRLLFTAPESSRPGIEKEFGGFKELFSRYLTEANQPGLNWEKIKLLQDDSIKAYEGLSTPSDAEVAAELNKLVVVKLNGGLGTSMGCVGPKSLITVRNDLSFLDLNIQHLEKLNSKFKTKIPLVLMNSFNTDEDTTRMLRKYHQTGVPIHSFLQSRYPRINKATLLPMATTLKALETEEWYPPGHGNLYRSFYDCGLVDKFIEEGKEWLFVANIDNLGATVDLPILHFLCQAAAKDPNAPEFLMEVTPKTMADVKGGTLVDYEGKLRLLEIAQVPKDHVDEFKSVSKFKIFNTNNLWVNLPALKRVVESAQLHMEIIVNPKTLADGTNVLQLETAVGAAIKSFEGAVGVSVPRTRFLPVKKTQDLLVVMSNLYTLVDGTLQMNTRRFFQNVPLVKLGSSFDKVSDFLLRFASVPNILELEHLTVSGDVTFGKNVTLKGNVIIIANHGDRIDIPSGALLENKIVSGNLRILDH